MPAVLSILFWACVSVIIYTYFGYPLLVLLLSNIKRAANPPSFPNSGFSALTLVVAAYNEEKCIAKKLENCAGLEYPAGLLTLLVVTDGSTDKTPAIVSGYPGATLLHEPNRKGKAAAMNRAMARVQTPLAVFSDANTLLNRDALVRLAAHFSDEMVGGVAGEKRISSAGSAVGKGEGLYWRYESWLKKLDSRLKTTVGAAGELFALRSALYTPLPENTVIEDFVQSLLLCVKGYVVRYDPGAWAEEPASLNIRDEWERKVRISAGAFQAMGMLGPLFNIFRFPLVSFQFISHRIFRWTICPLALLVLFVTSANLYVLTGSAFYEWIFGLQLAGYLAAAVGAWLALRNRRVPLLFPLFYFIFMNVCVFAGFARFATKGQSPLWQKAAR